jgi:hypothetical protein
MFAEHILTATAFLQFAWFTVSLNVGSVLNGRRGTVP